MLLWGNYSKFFPASSVASFEVYWSFPCGARLACKCFMFPDFCGVISFACRVSSSRGSGSFMERLPRHFLSQAHKAVVFADNQMIHDINIQDFSRVYDMLCCLKILVRWGWVAAWVIVAQKHIGTLSDDCGTEDFSGAKYGTIDCPLIEQQVRDNMIFCI